MDLEINKQGYLVSGTHRECTKCHTIFRKTNKMTLCHQCNSTRVKGQDDRWKMHQRAKQRAKLSGLEFNLKPEDIVIPRFCPVVGVELVSHCGASGGRGHSPSLDRIDNTKGYTKDNIQVISHLANMMKGSATPEQLIKFSEYYLSKLTKPNELC